MQETTLEGGFADAPRDAAHAFRACMNAMARPGRIETLRGATPPAPLSQAAGTLLLTLCDADTPVHLAGAHDCDAVRQWLAFHTGAPLAHARTDATFAIGVWDALLPLSDYPIGTARYPDRSATLVVEMDSLTATGARLTGPGIADSAALSLPDIAALRANHALFPQGLDFYFAAGEHLAALPRSTNVEDA
ncbi:phosphonate C-P lyase system protein PhnH [Sediminimonas qiaohouensis]|uniref:phosphonate C-P lyase system protein PhnH n=1 Tax=Sediminimonas qiaohouensis TaxID=552061 RepID=UPI0003FC8A6C|nr:phosphonate C-P lyase system protein PhnH [Sediminimonas qiaohouensis]